MSHHDPLWPTTSGRADRAPLAPEEHVSLCEALDRVLHKGVVIHGDVTLSVANIDLVYLGLRVLLSSVDTARRANVLPVGLGSGAQIAPLIHPDPGAKRGPAAAGGVPAGEQRP